MKEILDENDWYKNARAALCRRERTINGNLRKIKARSRDGYRHLIETELKNLDATIARYSSGNGAAASGGKLPLLCKYVNKDYAIKDVRTGQIKFGSVREYRHGDGMECTLPILPESRYDDLLATIQANIIREIMEEQNLDIGYVYSRFQDRIQDNCFIGCFSDGSNPEYMWTKYADSNGICIWFEPDDPYLVRITYAEYLEKASDLRRRYQDLMYRIATDRDESVFKDLDDLTREFIDLSIMSFYTKGPDYMDEAEWRIIVPCNDKNLIMTDEESRYIIRPIPGRIIKIESRMPQEKNEMLMEGLDPGIGVIFAEPR